MHTSHRVLARAAVAGVLIALAGLAFAAPAHAWSNGGSGGNGFGTHDWVIDEAARLAGNPAWLNKTTAFRASDDPDMVLKDWGFHAYDEWGDCEGQAPLRVAGLWTKTISAYKKRDYAGASKQLGLLAHYYSDVCNPLHTDNSSSAETLMHSAYETRVNAFTNSRSENHAWIVNDGFQRVTNITSKTVLAARSAHPRYTQLVSSYRASGYSRWVAASTRTSLNRAVNDLADIIRSVPSSQVSTAPVDMLPDGVISWRDAWMYEGAQVTVQGPVVSTTFASKTSGQPTFLNVGAPYPSVDRLTILIWGDHRAAFSSLPKPPQVYYFGRTVRVTGRVQMYKGAAEIVVEKPAAIEVMP